MRQAYATGRINQVAISSHARLLRREFGERQQTDENRASLYAEAAEWCISKVNRVARPDDLNELTNMTFDELSPATSLIFPRDQEVLMLLVKSEDSS